MDSVELIELNATPSALALSRSMSICSCGASSRPSGRTWVSTLLCEAMPSNWLRALTSAVWPLPPRSCRRSVKPDELPSSGMGGGLKANTKASRTPDIAPMMRPAIASAECSAPWRSPQSLSVMNARPAFWPWPEKLKPSTLTMLETSGCCSANFSTSSITAWVRCSVAPGGSWTLAMTVPWSSPGRKEVGRFLKTSAAAPRMAT
ncbi:hypothetical protein D3C71_1562340 [compost metagenome]